MQELALSPTLVTHLPVYGAAIVVVVLGVVLLRRAPRVAFAGWLVGVCFVPVWVDVTIKVTFEPHVLASLGLVVCLLAAGDRGRRTMAGRFTIGDALFIGFALSSLVPIASGRVTFSDLFVLLVQWTAAFLAGRLVGYRVPLPWVYGAVAVAFTVVAVLALVEFVTTFNPFVLVPGHDSLHTIWAPIQMRGGHPRAEGAFGHSIALGSSLALAVPMTLEAPFRTAIRLPMVVLMLAASVVTFSRIGLVTAVLGAVVTVLFLGRRLPVRLRLAVIGGMAGVAVGFSSLVSKVFSAAGAEASDSAGYRLSLLHLVGDLIPFGYTSTAYTSGGHLILANVPSVDGTGHSIDDALLLIGMTYGWVPLLFVLAMLAVGVFCLLRGRVTAPTIAVLAQVPAFVTVALITQYSTFSWFVAGLAVFAQSASAARPSRPAPRISLERMGQQRNSPALLPL